MAQHNVTGRSGEDFAADYLKKRGYKVIAANFRSKVGEIDIIAKDGNQVVFVEVKTRSSNRFGTPSEAITPKKLHSLIQAGQYYLLVNKLNQNYRIDAVEVIIFGGKVHTINHIINITL